MRPRRWRWLVVQHDLPPMPKRPEVVWGYLTKRRAEHEALMLRYAHTPPLGGPVMVRIEVVKRGQSGRTDAP